MNRVPSTPLACAPRQGDDDLVRGEQRILCVPRGAALQRPHRHGPLVRPRSDTVLVVGRATVRRLSADYAAMASRQSWALPRTLPVPRPIDLYHPDVIGSDDAWISVLASCAVSAARAVSTPALPTPHGTLSTVSPKASIVLSPKLRSPLRIYKRKLVRLCY